MSATVRRPSPARPLNPPPYPGRSALVNYHIDDPQHWKNNLGQDKKLQVTTTRASPHPEVDREQSTRIVITDSGGGERQCSPSVVGSDNERPIVTCVSPPATRPSPVAAGAILTLGELKRKQMHKRRCKLAASASPSGFIGDNYLLNDFDTGAAAGVARMMMESWQKQPRSMDEEREEDDAEVSLELKLRHMLERVFFLYFFFKFSFSKTIFDFFSNFHFQRQILIFFQIFIFKDNFWFFFKFSFSKTIFDFFCKFSFSKTIFDFFCKFSFSKTIFDFFKKIEIYKLTNVTFRLIFLISRKLFRSFSK